MSRIRPIDSGSVHRICSGQVVVDIASAAKELVENSLDAGATMIEVRLVEGGISSIEVSDNGSGIDESDYETVALAHHTSKLRCFDDLSEVRSFGFRGEALSALCSLASMSLSTRTSSQSIGNRLSFDSIGRCLAKVPVSRDVGTSVKVEGLFSGLPVRRRELISNSKRETAKLLTLINAYALSQPAVRFRVVNHPAHGPIDTMLNTNGRGQLKEVIGAIFGVKQLQQLCPVDEIEVDCVQ